MQFKKVLAILILGWVSVAFAAAQPYDEKANAKAEVDAALTKAQSTNRAVLVIFGANWCPDCRALDAAMQSTKMSDLISREFIVVKVDVGNFDRNLPISDHYGSPIKRGIPAAVVVSPTNQLLYATKRGELSNARRMGETGVYDFFSSVVASSRMKK